MNGSISRRAAGRECAAILGQLPEWFGMPASNTAYAALADEHGAYLFERDGVAIAVMILKDHGPSATEIYLLAVAPSAHRQGIGKALIEHARQFARARGAKYLTAKTRGPSAPYEPYERTRAFWLAMGFTPLEEFVEIWGPENPCLFMVLPA